VLAAHGCVFGAIQKINWPIGWVTQRRQLWPNLRENPTLGASEAMRAVRIAIKGDLGTRPVMLVAASRRSPLVIRSSAVLHRGQHLSSDCEETILTPRRINDVVLGAIGRRTEPF
jgi:hypothetical protein